MSETNFPINLNPTVAEKQDMVNRLLRRGLYNTRTAKLKPTGDHARDTVVAARINARRET